MQWHLWVSVDAVHHDCILWLTMHVCVRWMCVRETWGMLLDPLEACEGTASPFFLNPGELQIDGGGVASAHSSITHFIWVLEERKKEKEGIKEKRLPKISESGAGGMEG